MKAVICKKFAPVSELVWEEVADPVAGPGEIVIDVKAATSAAAISIFADVPSTDSVNRLALVVEPLSTKLDRSKYLSSP